MVRFSEDQLSELPTLMDLISRAKENVARKYLKELDSEHYQEEHLIPLPMAAVQVSLPLPVLPEGWAGEKDFKAIGSLSQPTQRNIEPVGPHFLAHARRVSLVLLASVSTCPPH